MVRVTIFAVLFILADLSVVVNGNSFRLAHKLNETNLKR